jgi:hypothetical protein
MGGVLLIARSRLRANLTATVLLVLLAGIGGGVVMASVAAIRRADSAWGRFQAANPTADAVMLVYGPDGAPRSTKADDLDEELAGIRDLDDLESLARLTWTVGVLEAHDGERYPVAATTFLDAPSPALEGRPLLLAGRLPDPSSADEVAVDELLARRLAAEVGDRIEFTAFPFDDIGGASNGRDVDPAGPRSSLRVTGVVRQPDDLLPPRTDQYALYAEDPYLLLTPAWWDANGPDVANYGVIFVADVRNGVDLPAVRRAVADRLGPDVAVYPGRDEVGVPDEVRRATGHQIAAEGRAVAAFAVAVAVVAVALLGLALARQLAAEGADRRDLRALGVSGGGLVAASVLRSLVVALGAACLAVVVAVGLSAFLPVGVGARILPGHGVDIDERVLVAGFVTVAALVVSLVALVGWTTGRERVRPPSRASLADRVARAGASLPASIGARFALERSRRGRAARAAVGVAAIAIALVVGAGGIVLSISHLERDAGAQGQVWDASAGNFASPADTIDGVNALRRRDDVDAIVGELIGSADIGGRRVSGVAYEPFAGGLPLELQEGRAPEDEHEAVMGAVLARSLGVEVGDTVPVTLSFRDDPQNLTVVGIGPVAAAGEDIDPGRALLVHRDLAVQDDQAFISVLLVRFKPGTDLGPAIAQLKADFPRTVLVAPVPSQPVRTLAGLTALPLALSATVVLLALAAAANGAIASVRLRRQDLAMLKVLGFERGQVRRVLSWQSLTWAALGLVVGVPLGLAISVACWREVVRTLGLSDPLTVPWQTVLAVSCLTPVLLLLLGRWPARAAVRVPAAVTLRSE